MFTDEQIETGKKNIPGCETAQLYSEHPDCVRIAAQWLSAQKKTKRPNRSSYPRPIKHIIESWGGRYVSTDDVRIAAHLLGLSGKYPYFNISARFVCPKKSRLDSIGEAMKHLSYCEKYNDRNTYATWETN